MKRLTIILSILLILPCTLIDARERKKDTLNVEIAFTDTLTNEFLDTVKIDKKLKLNDYSMVGIQGGVVLSQVMWNPKYKQEMILLPINFGVTYFGSGLLIYASYSFPATCTTSFGTKSFSGTSS